MQDRFEVGAQVSERQGVQRFRGLDHGANPPAPVWIIREPLPPAAEEAIPMAEAMEDAPPAEAVEEEILPGFDDVLTNPVSVTQELPRRPQWPSVAWEHGLLRGLEHPALPNVVASFVEDNFDYLIEEVPEGRVLWDAWDDPASGSEQRFGWLAQVAEALHCLHLSNVILEGIRPDIVVVSPEGRARLTDLSDLLPLPPPPDAPIRASLYTAPELKAGNGQVDARADLYSFGGHDLRAARRPRADRDGLRDRTATPSRSSRASPTFTRRSAGCSPRRSARSRTRASPATRPARRTRPASPS